MKREIILSIILLTLISLAVFVSADYNEVVSYSTTIQLEKGWNLVSIYAIDDIFDSNLGECYENYLKELGVRAVFYWDIDNKEYIRLYPNQEEDILFADQTTCYGVGNNPVSCTGWSWTFQDGNPATSNQQNPTIQFISSGSKDIGLETTDASGFSCLDSKNLEVGVKLPDWREILPW